MAICHRRRRKGGAPLLTERFLAQARQELAVGDLPQASEKGWGATAQILKAVAEQRGWEHDRHRHYLQITSRLRSETGDGDIRRLFNTASALHENFYENEMETADVADGLDDVEGLDQQANTLTKPDIVSATPISRVTKSPRS